MYMHEKWVGLEKYVHVDSACRGQERGFQSIELELQVAVRVLTWVLRIELTASGIAVSTLDC